MYKLAIVIPAYKITFLKDVLDSIANQTKKEFTLYIGDDGSPSDLYSVIKEYEDKINIVYKRFQQNFGGIDLVAQWRRCIDLVKDEEWVWLFSDDDVMSPDCVEKFYSSIEKTPHFHLYHFDVAMINDRGVVKSTLPEFPDLLSSEDFFMLRASNKISSFVIEYIFRRDIYDKYLGFQSFDLAWGSDHATWIKFASESGIKTIKETNVYWRYNSENISPNRTDKNLSIRKVQASVEYYLWVRSFFYEQEKKISDGFYIRCFNNDNKAYNVIVPWQIMNENIKQFTRNFGLFWLFYYVYSCLYMSVHRLYKMFSF